MESTSPPPSLFFHRCFLAVLVAIRSIATTRSATTPASILSSRFAVHHRSPSSSNTAAALFSLIFLFLLLFLVLVNKFRPFMSEIIGPLQGGFILGRGITYNIIIAQEIMHFMRNIKSRKGTIAFKIDLEKAYDRVDWRFLEATLVRCEFSKATINLILNCVTSSSLAVLWNGNRLQNFNPKRGLRQGDPMSPYLFVLCMEILACFISHKVSQGLWNPVAVSRNGPRLSNLMFADDLLLFCKASKAQVIKVMHCLDLFSRASGLKFLWKGQATGKELPLVRWEVAITPKRAGGLGIRDTSCANMALLEKLVLKHKYLRNQSGMNENSRNSSSATWKNIVSAYEHLKEGLHWNIENVHKSVWYDEWTPFVGVWPAATKKYSAREGYRWLLKKTLNWNDNSNWKRLWNTNIPEKFKFTMWLGLHDTLPTETFRFKRHLAYSDMCNKAQETMEHCLRDCERSKAIWHMLDPNILDSTAGTALEVWFQKALANNEASFGTGLWWVWRHRCNDIFNTDNPWTDHKVIALARITAKDL
ncbi:uncharacterized protein [Arachis hypogaea]|uniref:uncharacterized protein n=1 Tax=Arachis hypogaea TaxID=3818 RepID=UPI000DEC78B9|nr:uncharacterized protein LOC112742187 [Arachis hypogaea]